MSPFVEVSRWQRFKWALRRQRKPVVRLWTAEFEYVSTIADGGRETWRQWARRLGQAIAGRPCLGERVGLTLDSGAHVTIDN